MLNNITIMGYLAIDPELRVTTAGNPVCRFAIGNTRPTKEREVDFIEIVAMNKGAEFVNKWFKKGDSIVVMGRLQTQHLVNANTGRTTKKYEILASSVDFVPKPKATTGEDAPF